MKYKTTLSLSFRKRCCVHSTATPSNRAQMQRDETGNEFVKHDVHFLFTYANRALPMTSLFVPMTFAVNDAIDDSATDINVVGL